MKGNTDLTLQAVEGNETYFPSRQDTKCLQVDSHVKKPKQMTAIIA